MARIRPREASTQQNRRLVQAVVLYLFITLVFLLMCSAIPDNEAFPTNPTSSDPSSFRAFVVQERKQLLRQSKQLITGVEEKSGDDGDTVSIHKVVEFLSKWLHELHYTLAEAAENRSFLSIWHAYHDLVERTLIPWDKEYLTKRIPPRRTDNSIFLSIASYRDENCVNTLTWAFGNATYPKNLFIGLVQQNCIEDCKTGVLEGGRVLDAPPDPDCYDLFCEANPRHCGNVRILRVNETESLGPYGARYLASKLWYGESWYMQTDAHMTFLEDWDDISIKMLHKAPSEKPVLSHYPPGHKMDLHVQSSKPAGRLCGPLFATSTSENQIIRLEGLGKWDKVKLDIPRFAPFAAAGYFVAHSGFLREVPFDPLLPWIFMGEEIIMSTRLWTHGYDLFSPAQAVVGHIYVRPHKPKFWESNNRFFKGVGDTLEIFVLNRIKFQLGYPEAARDMILEKSLLDHVSLYGMGRKRSLKEYLKSVGLDMMEKQVTETQWCETGKVPPGKEEYRTLYREAVLEEKRKQANGGFGIIV